MILHRARSALPALSVGVICLAVILWTTRGSGVPSAELANLIGVERVGGEAAVGQWDYRRALQYEGSGARIQAFLEKARSGKPFTVAVIGGSVSKGRGLRRWQDGQFLPDVKRRRLQGASKGQNGSMRRSRKKREDDDDELFPLHANPELHHAGGGRQGLQGAERPDQKFEFGTRTLYSPENMHVQIFNYLNSTFPHADNRFVNGAQGGVGSGYFGWCFKEHIPEDTDLVLVELGINDLVEIDGFETYEMLVRRLLELKSQPAIINIEVFTTLFPTLLSSSSLHTDVAAFYDIPSISIRDVLLPRITDNPDVEMPKWFRTGPNVWPEDPKVRDFGGVSVDLMHISALGHAFTANIVIQYFQEQLKEAQRASSTGRGHLGLENGLKVPSATLTTKWDILGSNHPQNPICRTMNSANLHSALGVSGTGGSSTHGIVPADGSHGWEKYHFKEKKYLVAKKPGAKFVYNFNVATGPVPEAHGEGVVGNSKKSTPRGTVSIGYQRSKILGFGAVLCWVDEHKVDGKIIDGWWDIPQRNMGRVAEVAHDLTPGPHTLQCELLDSTHDDDGRTEFRIFAVMHN